MSKSLARKPSPSYRESGPQLVPLTLVDPERDSVKVAKLPEAGANMCGSDPSLIVPVVASRDDILRAQELRREIKKRYLGRSDQADSR